MYDPYCLSINRWIGEEIDRRMMGFEKECETITDGWTEFPRWCDCGEENEIVRPGKYQCPVCG